MSYSTQNLGSLMDDLGAEETKSGKSRARQKSDSVPFWRSNAFAVTLAVIAFAVCAGGVWYSFFSGGPPHPPGHVLLIDVKTGELFNAPTRRLTLPAKNPTTGERNLFPVEKGDDGQWRINQHYLGGVENFGYDSGIVSDIKNGTVHPADSSPKSYDMHSN